MRSAARLALWTALVIAAPIAAASDDGRVALLAPAGARLSDELARELATSGLDVVRLEATDWTRAAAALVAARTSVGVALAPDESRVVVFSVDGDATKPELELDLRAERRDRVARRRAWIAVVEHLRVRPSPPPPPPAPPPPPPRLAVVAPSIVAEAPRSTPASRWTLGAAASVAMGTRAEPLGHMVLVGDYALSRRIDVGVRGLWPLLGARADGGDGSRLRWWTFGGRGTFQLRLRERRAAVQPFVGAALGTQLLLADTVVREQTTVRWTPSATMTAMAGLRARVGSGALLLIELEAGDALRLGDAPVSPQHRAAAEARFFAAVAGMLFEY